MAYTIPMTSISLHTILGSTGNIGTALAKELTSYTSNIRLVSRNPQKVNNSDILFKADLLKEEEVKAAVKDSAVVYLVVGITYNTKIWEKQWPIIMKNVINAFHGETKRILQKIRETVSEGAPEATECINYGIPTYKLHGNLVHFAAYKKHIGFYPAPSGIEAFMKEVEPFKTGKGTLQFSLDKPIPYDLISDLVKFRMEENKFKTGKKTRNGL